MYYINIMQKHITKFLILTIVFSAALSVNYLFAAWVGPTQAPPGGNTSTPIHVGSTNQVKDGGLSVNALSVFGGGYFQGTIQVGNSGADDPQAGTIRWTGADFEGYDGTQWLPLVGAVPEICTSFEYTEWGDCQVDSSTQTRTVTIASPEGCIGGVPNLIQSCAPACTYTYTDWSACDGAHQKTRSVTSALPEGCSGSPVTTTSCTASQEWTGRCQVRTCNFNNKRCTTATLCVGCYTQKKGGGQGKYCAPGPKIYQTVYR